MTCQRSISPRPSVSLVAATKPVVRKQVDPDVPVLDCRRHRLTGRSFNYTASKAGIIQQLVELSALEYAAGT